MYLGVQSLFSFLTCFAYYTPPIVPQCLSSETCFQPVKKMYVFVYIMDMFSLLNLCCSLHIEQTAEEVEMENVVPMSSLFTKLYACRWPSPSWSCLWADGASTGAGPVQIKDTSPFQLWWGRRGQRHILTGFSKKEKLSMFYHYHPLHFWLLLK